MPMQQADLLSLLPVAIILLCTVALVMLIERLKRRARQKHRRGKRDAWRGRAAGSQSPGKASAVPFQIEESPIEERFRLTWQRLYAQVPLTPQYGIGRYRVDFASLDARVVVELDGHAYHSSPEQKAYDTSRQQQLEAWGWRVIRFTGSQVNRAPERCVHETWQLIAANQAQCTDAASG